jgi:hypothetical protein
MRTFDRRRPVTQLSEERGRDLSHVAVVFDEQDQFPVSQD